MYQPSLSGDNLLAQHMDGFDKMIMTMIDDDG